MHLSFASGASCVLSGKSTACLRFARGVFNVTGKWTDKLNRNVRLNVEKYWKDRLHDMDYSINNQQSNGQKYYVLSMFPYPSGSLHMGHVRVYTISDAMARYHRLHGQNVIHPMGWDAFGLPAENAAIERGEPPDKWTLNNIANMKKQLIDLGCNFDWHRELATCDPMYYKWTQYIFLQLFHAGLVYQKEAPVNWDPVDKTVLADEQIDENGCSWRSGAVVEKRNLKQWYIRTTAYSKSLLDGLKEVDADLWKDIIDLQAHWIGNCDGIQFDFQLLDAAGAVMSDPLTVFTRTPEAFYGVSHVYLSPSHSLNGPHYYKTSSSSDSNERELNIVAVHPLSGRHLPVFVAASRQFGEYYSVDLGIPSCSDDDREFAARHKLDFAEVYDGEKRHILNSDQFTGMSAAEAFTAIANYAKKLGCGGYITSEKARDWLISRQRYWGTPIPIVHCKKYGAVPVAYEDLPVELPAVTQFRGLDGISPLASVEHWLTAKCAKCDCDGFGRRETDTMDTFVDSSWYYLRYLDPTNQTELLSPTTSYLMPVDLYIGGKEHAILHLYYARFVSHFLHSIGVVQTREPFVNLLTQGMVMGRSFRLKDTGRYLRPHEVEWKGSVPVEASTKCELIVEWEKMSKSKYNGVDPQDVISEYGIDTTRLCILSNVSPKSERLWSDDVFVGVLRWQGRVWSLVSQFISQRRSAVKQQRSCSLSSLQLEQIEFDIFNARNVALKEVSHHMNNTFLLNAAISRLHSLTAFLKKVSVEAVNCSYQYERALAELVVMISPFAPMFACELWAGLATAVDRTSQFNWTKSVLEQRWPTVDDNYRPPMSVKINGREIFEIPLPMCHSEISTVTEEEAFTLAQQHSDFESHVNSKPILRRRLCIRTDCLKVDLDLTIDVEKTAKTSADKRSRVDNQNTL